jgi:hypothetical protein
MNEKVTDFMRPTVNLLYYVHYILFKDNWNYYLLFNYLINSLALLLVFWISRKFLNLSLIKSIFASIFFFIISSTPQFFVYPCFISDALVGVILVGVFITCIRQRYKTAIVLLILAFLTKETAVFAPFVSSITYLFAIKYQEGRVTRRKIVNAAMILVLPLLFFLTLRILFHGGFSGTYATDSLGTINQYLMSILSGLAYWPSYIVGYRDLIRMNPIPIAINGFFVMVVGFITIIQLKRWKKFININQKKEDVYQKLLVIWTLGSSVLLIFLALEKRYAYTFFIFLIPLLMSFLNLKKYKFVVLVYLLVASFGVFSKKEIPVFSYHKNHHFTNPGVFHQLMDVLSSIEVEKDENVYLINDRSGICGAACLFDFAKKRKTDNFIVLNSVHKWWNYDGTDTSVEISRDSFKTNIRINLSKDMLFWFPGTNKEKIVSNILASPGNEIILKRNSKIRYKIHHRKADNKNRKSGKDWLMLEYFGTILFRGTLEIEIDAKKGKYIYFDFKDHKYKILEI